MSMLKRPPDVLRVGTARLLDGYSERDGRSFIDGREVEVRFLENAD